MRNFDWTKFTKRIAVKADIKDIYNAWTSASGIEKWFLSNADYADGNGKTVDKQALIAGGYSYAWSWFLYDVVERGKIISVNGSDHIQFTFAGECLVDVKLKTVDDYVLVELTQTNIPTDDESKQRIRLGCDSGWSFYLMNLKSYYESGHDLRNKNEAFKGMINN